MTDIVERLQHDADSFNDCCLLCSEAADEIERNRAAIDELVGALLTLCKSADESDSFRFGILSTSFVRRIASAAIAKHQTTTEKEQ